MILDASSLLDVMASDPATIARAEEIETADVTARLSSMTVYELNYGVEIADASIDEQRRVDRTIEAVPIVDPDRTIVRKTGGIEATLDQADNPIDDADVIIGATGVVLEEPVLTRNADHIERIPDLVVETY
jgi:tRNA(fMet)-specific endonuclease VapC